MSNFGRQTRYIMGDVQIVDCKTVRIFAYSSKREQSNKRSGTRLKTESETGERQFFSLARVRLVRHALPISLLILRKKTDCFAVYANSELIVAKTADNCPCMTSVKPRPIKTQERWFELFCILSFKLTGKPSKILVEAVWSCTNLSL